MGFEVHGQQSMSSSTDVQTSTAPKDEIREISNSRNLSAADTNELAMQRLRSLLEQAVNDSESSPPLSLQNCARMLSKLAADPPEKRVLKLEVARRVLHDSEACLGIFELVGFREEENVRLRWLDSPIRIPISSSSEDAEDQTEGQGGQQECSHREGAQSSSSSQQQTSAANGV